MWRAESFYIQEGFLSSHHVLHSVSLASVFLPFSHIDSAVVLLCVPAELYSICLARAKEKWKTSPAPVSETETEGRGSLENVLVVSC